MKMKEIQKQMLAEAEIFAKANVVSTVIYGIKIIYLFISTCLNCDTPTGLFLLHI